jgi:tetratricopeptide (TPR) repeat protein
MRKITPAFGLVLALTFAGPYARAEQLPMVDAKEGGVGIGGNVMNSTINIGVPPDKVEELVQLRTKDLSDLNESQRERIALLKQALGLTQGQISHALKIVGEANIPPEQLAEKLDEIAEKFKDLQLAAAAQPGDDAKITALKVEAQKAIQDGQLGKADEILATIEKAQTEALDRLALNAAQTTAQRGDVALGRLRYLDAAQRFAEAAAKVPSGEKDERWKYLNEEANALFKQGLDFGDNAAAVSAIERYRALVELRPRNAFPDDWATIQNNLGDALTVLGQSWESGTARLQEAVSAHRAALQEFTRERVPLRWAMTQNHLGFALFRLGERESGTERLEEAVSAYRSALQENTRERAPLRWGMTQKNLGLALTVLGAREKVTSHLAEAIAVLQEALQENTRARAPLQWAFIQNNLGLALAGLGEREEGTARLEAAIAAYREALQEQTRARVPHQWAMDQEGLGHALLVLGKRKNETARLEEAVAAYRESLQENTRDRLPLLWAQEQNGLGQALQALGEREGGTARLQEAVAAYRDALQEYTRDRAPLLWAMTQRNLGLALKELGEREGGTARLEEAVAAYHEALQENTRERAPLLWAVSTGSQGVALTLLAGRRLDAEMAKLAVQQIETAIVTLRYGGDARLAAFYEARLLTARALVDQLAER